MSAWWRRRRRRWACPPRRRGRWKPTGTSCPSGTARELLQALRPHCRLGVVTNCSERLGHRAAALLGVEWDVVVTSEEAGYYKPDPRPYALALARLEVEPPQAAFIAGSGYDMFGTSKVGLRTYWHNRVGLTLPDGAARPERESPGLDAALPWLAGFHAG